MRRSFRACGRFAFFNKNQLCDAVELLMAVFTTFLEAWFYCQLEFDTRSGMHDRIGTG